MATPNYTELAAHDDAFRKRCSIAVSKYAIYILNEDPAVALHSSRAAWAKSAISNSDGIVNQLMNAIVLDGKFTQQNPLNFTTTTDSDLQIAVEATINYTLLKF